MRSIRVAALTFCLALLGACGSPPPPSNATPVETQVANVAGPRVLYESVLAANDLATLRALVDAMSSVAVRQLGGTPRSQQCSAPYSASGGYCWQGIRSEAGQAYIAVDITGGFCTDESAPQLYRQTGRHLILQVNFTTRFNCHISGSMALPTATLVSFPTAGLAPGLYSVSFRSVTDGDVYKSDATYLSLPGPISADQATVESEAGAALASLTTDRRVGLFSLARVAGDQLQSLCGQTTTGAAYLAVIGPDLSASRREMTVVLAGPAPHTCAVTAV